MRPPPKLRRPIQYAIVLAACGVALLVGAGALAARQGPYEVAVAGMPPFVLDDFGGISRATLETNALPYKVVATALLIREEQLQQKTLGRADLPAIFRQFGFLFPAYIANWPAAVPQ